MDDEDKIKDIATLSKSHFLREVIREIKERRKVYSLEEEFVKTKKNRKWTILFIIGGFIVIFAAASIIVTQFIQRESKTVRVSIADFEDVNLRDVLDVAKKNESEMKIARRELEDLRAEMDEKILEIRNKAGQDIEIISNKRISDSEKKAEIREIRLGEKRAVKEIEDEYGGMIMLKEEEIAKIQEGIDAYDARLIEQAQKQEEIFNNQARIYDIEMDKTVSYYNEKIDELTRNHEREILSAKAHQEELTSLLKKNHAQEIERLTLRYNPVFTSETINKILEQEIDEGFLAAPPLGEHQKILQREGVLNSVQLAGMRAQLSDLSLLIDKLQEVPYINSVPSALDHIEYLGYVIIHDYEKLKERFVNVIEKKNSQIAEQKAVISERNSTIKEKEAVIDQYRYSLDFLTYKNRENGYIIDQRDPERLVVFLNKIHKIQDGDLGYVFRKEDEYIATIKFHVSEDSVTASLVELGQEDKPMEPFDRILIDLQ